MFGDLPVEQESIRPIVGEVFATLHLIGLVLAYDDGLDYELLKVQGDAADWFEGKPMRA